MKIKTQNNENYIITGKEYIVLGIEAGSYRIINEIGEPCLYGPEGFEVTDESKPSFWVCEVGKDDEKYCYPKEWNGIGFFEDYFNGVVEAKSTFNRVLKQIYAQ